MTIAALRGHRPEVLDDLLARFGREIQGVAYLILRDRSASEGVVVDVDMSVRGVAAALGTGENRDATGLIRVHLP